MHKIYTNNRIVTKIKIQNILKCKTAAIVVINLEKIAEKVTEYLFDNNNFIRFKSSTIITTLHF